MEELEEKGQTILAGRTPISDAKTKNVLCMVDGCLSHAAVACEVKVANRQLNPDNETHRINLCKTHDQGFQTLKWQWRRTPDAPSQGLKLDGVYALDTVEDA